MRACELAVIPVRINTEAYVRKPLRVSAPVRDRDAEDAVVREREHVVPLERAHLDVEAHHKGLGDGRGLDEAWTPARARAVARDRRHLQLPGLGRLRGREPDLRAGHARVYITTPSVNTGIRKFAIIISLIFANPSLKLTLFIYPALFLRMSLDSIHVKITHQPDFMMVSTHSFDCTVVHVSLFLDLGASLLFDLGTGFFFNLRASFLFNLEIGLNLRASFLFNLRTSLLLDLGADFFLDLRASLFFDLGASLLLGLGTPSNFVVLAVFNDDVLSL